MKVTREGSAPGDPPGQRSAKRPLAKAAKSSLREILNGSSGKRLVSEMIKSVFLIFRFCFVIVSKYVINYLTLWFAKIK